MLARVMSPEPPSILVVLGNRPQFVKHAALARAWATRSDEARAIVVDTGQHYDHALAGIFVDELAIPEPDYSLGVGSASHAEQLARMLPPLEEIVLRERPASVVVYGDTNSTLGGRARRVQAARADRARRGRAALVRHARCPRRSTG